MKKQVNKKPPCIVQAMTYMYIDEEGCSSATLIVVSMMCSLFAFAGGLIVAALIVRMYYVKTHNKYMAIQPTAEFGSN